jgi:hypothetical protein
MQTSPRRRLAKTEDCRRLQSLLIALVLSSVWNGLCACGTIEPNLLMLLYYGGARLLDFFMSGLYCGGRLLVFFSPWLLHWYDELKWCFCMGCAPVWMDSILPVLNV